MVLKSNNLVILDTFYIKESNNLIGTENFVTKTEKLL